MLDLSLFRKPAFNGVSAVAFGLSAGMFAMFLYLTIYMQGVLDFSPLETGCASCRSRCSLSSSPRSPASSPIACRSASWSVSASGWSGSGFC